MMFKAESRVAFDYGAAAKRKLIENLSGISVAAPLPSFGTVSAELDPAPLF